MSEANQLTEALKKASAEPEARPAFYELLLKTTIFVPGIRREGQNGAAPQFGFKQWPQPTGATAIPFFPDLEGLQKTLGQEEPYLTLPTLDLFRMTRGTTLVLTCQDGLGKAFKPDEVDMILSSGLALDPLAAALEKAVREENNENKATFYRIFINSQVFVFGEPRTPEGEPRTLEGEPAGPRPLGPDDKFVIATISHPQKEGERIIPFFSSGDLLQRAAKAANLPPQTTFLGLPSLNLLKMARGMGLPMVLNLGPMTYKIFHPEEIDFLLAQVKPPPMYEERQLPAGSQVALTPPEVYPQELVRVLLDSLPGLPEVKAAYLTTMKENSPEAEPVLVIGLETEEGADISEILRKTTPLVASHAPKGQAVDFTQVKPGEKGLSQLLLEKIEPFYRRPLPGTGALRTEALQGPETPEGTVAPAAQEEGPTAPTAPTGLFARLKRVFKG